MSEPHLELRIVETSPRSVLMTVSTPTQQTDESRVFKVAYHRGKSFVGMVSGGDENLTVLNFPFDNDDLKGIVALVDGGYDNEAQQSTERKIELVTVEKYPMTVGEWSLPREKHERPIRMDMITGALKSLMSL